MSKLKLTDVRVPTDSYHQTLYFIGDDGRPERVEENAFGMKLRSAGVEGQELRRLVDDKDRPVLIPYDGGRYMATSDGLVANIALDGTVVLGDGYKFPLLDDTRFREIVEMRSNGTLISAETLLEGPLAGLLPDSLALARAGQAELDAERGRG